MDFSFLGGAGEVYNAAQPVYSTVLALKILVFVRKKPRNNVWVVGAKQPSIKGKVISYPLEQLRYS